MKNVFLGIGFLLALFVVYQRHLIAPNAVGLKYKDVQGREHSIQSPCKPAVIAFWTSPLSPASQRSLEVLDRVRAGFPERLLDVTAIFLDRGLETDVAALAASAGHTATIAVAQTSSDDSEINALRERFKPRNPGEDIYVVDSKAGIHVVDASDPKATTGVLEAAVRMAIETSVSF